ncbi:MAG: hypothetical protein KatS3mg129_2221 [Leptospiraceae bacterium]|nr:MAG: hypothetical protein KatS3mg129_2221 [Leptospiraceae bacterium]
MKLTHSKSKIEKDQIQWYLYAYRIDLSKNELFDIVKNIKQIGLFNYLDKERPALKSQLISILENSVEQDFWENIDPKISKEKYMESFLEQCLLDIYYKIKR